VRVDVVRAQWHKHDATFRKPKLNFMCTVDVPAACAYCGPSLFGSMSNYGWNLFPCLDETPRSMVVAALYVACVNDQLNQFA
jgi:hypothetical protein